jgi:hypothetical protein
MPDPESPFIKSLGLSDTPKSEASTSSEQESRARKLRERKPVSSERNIRFNHSVLKSTSDTFYDIAIAQGWTMNKTLTEAAKLLVHKFPPKNGDS